MSYILSIIKKLILLIFLGSCMRIYEPTKAEIEVGNIILKSEKIISKKYKIKTVGTGISMPSGIVHEIGLAFFTSKILTKEQIRTILVDCAQVILSEIQINEEIQSHLVKRPASLDNVQVIIYNNDEKGNSPKDPEIAAARISEGTLFFLTDDPDDCFKYKNRYSESYEEALQALQCE